MRPSHRGDESGEATRPAPPLRGADDAAALQEDITDLSDEEQITRVGEEWAEPFGGLISLQP